MSDVLPEAQRTSHSANAAGLPVNDMPPHASQGRDLSERIERAREIALTHALDVDREARFPHANFDAFRELGLLAATVPQQDGGLGLGPAGDLDGLRTLITSVGSACASTGQCLSVHLGAATTLGAIGTPAQRTRFHAEMRRGALFASAGSEPGQRRTLVGNAVRRGTLLVEHGDGYRLDGAKFFCTNSAAAEWLVVFAVLPHGGRDHTVNVMVHREDPGVTIRDSWDAFGQRGTASGAVEFDAVPIPRDRLLGEAPEAFEQAIQLPPSYQLGFAIQLQAIAQGALDFALDYLRRDAVPGVGLASALEDPLLALQIAPLAARVQAARAAVAHAGGLVQRLFAGKGDVREVAAEVGLAKETATLAALDVGSGILEVCGARAVSSRYRADRFWRNARTLSLHDALARRRVGIGQSLFGVSDKSEEGGRVQFRL